jgi:hypothetical protein
MKEIRNRTQAPLRVPLARGRVLHLGPGRTGQVSDDALQYPAFRKLVEAGSIEVFDDGKTESFGEESGGATTRHEATHGHHPPTVVLPKGNR